MKKKFLAFVLSGAMLMGSAITAFADVSGGDVSGGDVSGGNTLNTAETAAEGQEITGTTTVNLPTIEIIVPTTANIVLNPFQLSYTDADGAESTNQVISAVQTITNKSNVGVAVNVVDLKAVPTSNVKVATGSAAKLTDKSIFLYLAVADTEANLGTAYDKTKKDNQVIIPGVAADATKGAVDKEEMVILAAGNETATTAKFTIGGDMVANPTKKNDSKELVSDPWTASDGVTVSFKFTFTTQVATPAAP